MATRQSKNYGFTLQDNNEFVDIETTAANFEKVDTELKDVSDKTDSNAESIEDLEATAAELEKEIAALKATQESGGTVSAEVSAKITALESQLTTVNANITNLKSRTTNLETKMTTAEDDIDDLEVDMNTVNKDIDSLETKMTTAEGDIDELEADMATAEKDIAALKANSSKVSCGTVLYSGSGKVSEDITKYSVVIVKYKNPNFTDYTPVLCTVQNDSGDLYIRIRGMSPHIQTSNKYDDLVYISIEKSSMTINTSNAASRSYTSYDFQYQTGSFKEIIGVI